MDNLRKNDRVKALNLAFISLDEKGQVENEGMGRTLDVSESGMLLETTFPMKRDQHLTVTIAVEEELVEIQGRVVRCHEAQEHRYHSGLVFIDIEAESLEILKKFVVLFKEIESIGALEGPLADS